MTVEEEEVEGREGQGLAGEQAATVAAARVMMSRRRREEEETSLAAVGACLVSSSVRKDGKVRALHQFLPLVYGVVSLFLLGFDSLQAICFFV